MFEPKKEKHTVRGEEITIRELEADVLANLDEAMSASSCRLAGAGKNAGRGRPVARPGRHRNLRIRGNAKRVEH